MEELRAVLDELGEEIAAHPLAEGVDGYRSAAAFRLNLKAHQRLRWFRLAGVQIKGIRPFLLDFPSQRDGHDILLCWREGEAEIAWYHDPASGFAGRQRL